MRNEISVLTAVFICLCPIAPVLFDSRAAAREVFIVRKRTIRMDSRFDQRALHLGPRGQRRRAFGGKTIAGANGA